eukprot:1653632-Prymnesium_polylepis.1
MRKWRGGAGGRALCPGAHLSAPTSRAVSLWYVAVGRTHERYADVHNMAQEVCIWLAHGRMLAQPRPAGV